MHYTELLYFWIVLKNTGEGVKSAPDPDAGLPNGLGNVAMIDDDANGTADRAYAGDLFGNLYRFDLSGSNTSLWSVTKIFQATYDETAATRQPIMNSKRHWQNLPDVHAPCFFPVVTRPTWGLSMASLVKAIMYSKTG